MSFANSTTAVPPPLSEVNVSNEDALHTERIYQKATKKSFAEECLLGKEECFTHLSVGDTHRNEH